ncbi:sulfatase [Horticoccus sp. 23ND18S-11]|uniref:sulfatase n=1 Tax=Horticoccus sp. 23ND18S-11 TaxID=3391832 RepID=UPI0039C98D18
MIALTRFTLLFLLVATTGARSLAAERAASPPNIVFILIDDMPWFGTPVRMSAELPESAMAFRHMPNVEKLAAQGMTFRNAYAAAGMCGPSRCSIQTGMMTARHLYSGNGGFGEKTNGTVQYLTRGQDAARPLLAPEPQGNLRFPSIGDLFKSAGYATAHFGKWHLYGGGPAKHGYDESDGETDNKTCEPIDAATGQRSDTSDDPKLMFSITRRSVDFIERQAKAGRPFFLQVSHYATHARYQATKTTLAKYEKNPLFATITNPRERSHAVLGAAMVDDLDTAIGQVLQKLDTLGLTENTYVVFTTDNGYRLWNESHDPLRGAKWWLWENGIRVPLIVRGPAVPAASRCAVNVVGYDFLPTFADLAGATAKLGPNLDGVSFKRLLLGGAPTEQDLNRPLYFHYPHYRISPPASALIVGDTKLMHWYEWPEQRFVYDLRRDLGEKQNVAAANPERTAQLQQQLMSGLKTVGAYFPKPNPNADPKAKRYDPANLADQGEGGDPEANATDAPPAGVKKNGKAKKR